MRHVARMDGGEGLQNFSRKIQREMTAWKAYT
jgi:hypothetical protein